MNLHSLQFAKKYVLVHDVVIQYMLLTKSNSTAKLKLNTLLSIT